MRIRVTRSGGLLGKELELGEVETEQLEEREAGELSRLAGEVFARAPDVEQAAEPGAGSGAPRAADRFQYHLRLDGRGGERRIDLSEERLDEPARELIRRVSEKRRD